MVARFCDKKPSCPAGPTCAACFPLWGAPDTEMSLFLVFPDMVHPERSPVSKPPFVTSSLLVEPPLVEGVTRGSRGSTSSSVRNRPPRAVPLGLRLVELLRSNRQRGRTSVTILGLLREGNVAGFSVKHQERKVK